MATERELQTALDFVYSASLSNPVDAPILRREMANLLLNLLPAQVPKPEITAEQAAMEWLDRCTRHFVDPSGEQAKHVSTIKKMLAKCSDKPLPKISWWITGYSSNNSILYSNTAYSDAQRDSFYRSACGTAGCVRITVYKNIH